MECVVLGNLFVGVDTKRPPRFFIHVDIVPLASPLVDIDTRPSVGADGIDEALSGAFAHAEAASEFSTETSSAAAARFGPAGSYASGFPHINCRWIRSRRSSRR